MGGAGCSDVRHALYACRKGCEGCGECLCTCCCACHCVPRGVPCQCSAHPERDEPCIRRRYAVLLLLGVWKHQGKRLLPVFVFFASVIGAISYYAELCGVGTHTAAGGHLLFYTRYADAALALPILAGVVAAMSRMHRHAIVALVANTLFAVAAEFIGANVVSHYKWGWFALAVVFTFMAVEQIVRVMQDTATSEQLKVLCALLLVAYLAYPIKWCVGAEGSGRLATATEVGAIAFVDVVSRLGFGFYLLLHSDELENANPALLANDKAQLV